MSLENKLFPAAGPAPTIRPWEARTRKRQCKARALTQSDTVAPSQELEKTSNSELELSHAPAVPGPEGDKSGQATQELAKISSPRAAKGPQEPEKAVKKKVKKVAATHGYRRTSRTFADDMSEEDPLLPECPFYHRDDGVKRIWCEGILPGGVVVLHCPTYNAFRTQWQTFCTARYHNCELYHAAMEKYED